MLIFFHGLPNLRICSFGFAVSLFRDPPRLAPASSRRRRRVITLYFAAVNADYHMGILYAIVTLRQKSNQRTPQPLTLATLSFLTASSFGNCLSNFAAPVADPWISKIILSKLA